MRVVIVGAGQAAASVAIKLRDLGHEGEIVMIGDEPAPPYQRPPLSKAYLLGTMEEERLWLRTNAFWQDKRIELRLGRAVTRIDRRQKIITTGNGAKADILAYDQLVLTTGSVPRRIPAGAGGELPGVHTVRTLADIHAMRPEFVQGRRVVVIGGGYIGLEAAAVASQLGLIVVMLQSSSRVLTRVASAETANFISELHEAHGVDIMTNAVVERIRGADRATSVRLANGQEIPADFVITGIGITPESSLAEAAGLTFDNGIATDSFGRTSDPSIWAAGDCTSFPWHGRRIRLEAVCNAIDQGEAVAANILGAEQPYIARPWFWSDQYDLKMQIAGLNDGHDRVVTHAGPPPSYWYYRGDELLAVDSMGDARAYMVGKRLIDNGRSPEPERVATTTDLRELMKAG